MSETTTLESEIAGILHAYLRGSDEDYYIQYPKDTEKTSKALASFIREREKALRKDYEEVLASHRSLVKEIDEIMNGDNAAEQASLCDLLPQIEQKTKAAGEWAQKAMQKHGEVRSLQSDLASAKQTIQELQEFVELVANQHPDGNPLGMIRAALKLSNKVGQPSTRQG